MSKIYPVILSGGVGSRLWPLSRSLFPKQLLSLVGDHTLLQDTVRRTQGPQFEAPLIVCNIEHRFLVAEQIRAIKIDPLAILLEPVSRNTAPAAAVAALRVAEQDPHGVILLMAADHLITNHAAFHRAVAVAAEAAESDNLVTFGIEPHSPETGFGYIQRGEPLQGVDGVLSVKRFVEKPDRATAQSYVASGEYLWNSGMFAFKAKTFLDELERLDPKLLAQCRSSVAGGTKDLTFLRLDADGFDACRSISIDYAVMERTNKAAVVPVEMGWSDIGSWESLWECSSKDDAGNMVKGDVLRADVHNSYLRSEGPLIAAVGLEDIVVVASVDAVLVSHKSASQDVKKIVEQLELAGRDLHVNHRKVFQPWGMHENIDAGDHFRVRRVTINPRAQLPFQKHPEVAEHWVIVSGTARITRGDEVFNLNANESIFVPQGTPYCLENTAETPLRLIEVQLEETFRRMAQQPS